MSIAQLEGRFERLLSVNGSVSLNVATDSGTIRVSTGEAGTVQVRGILRAGKSILGLGDPESRLEELETNPPVEQDGNEIRIGHVSDSWFSGHITMLLDITVPRETAIRAQVDSGGIRIEGVQGPVDCTSDSGSIELVNIGARVRAEADSGSIRIRRVAGSVDAETDSGEIEALEIGGAIEVRADSGDIRLSQTIPADVRAEADSGSIRLRLVPGSGYTLRASADGGAIRVPEMSRSENSRHEVYGQIRGGGPRIDLQVDSGDIEVE